MSISNDDRAALVGDALEWMISAEMGARDAMRPDSPSWRFAEAKIAYLTHYRNVLLKYGGGVYSPEFAIPEIPRG